MYIMSTVNSNISGLQYNDKFLLELLPLQNLRELNLKHLV